MLGWGSLLDQINTGLSGVDDPAVAPEPHKISLKKKKKESPWQQEICSLKKVRNNGFGRNSVADRIFSDYT